MSSLEQLKESLIAGSAKKVKEFTEGAGYKVIDLGGDVPSEKFLQAIEAHHPQVIGISALLTMTMTQMKETDKKLKEQGEKTKIIVGAPL